MVAALLRPTSVSALFEKEVGVNDFLIATTGHGSIQTLYTCSIDGKADSVLTSDSVDAGKLMSTRAPTSCFVALREISSGSLIWRRNVCSTNAKGAHHIVTASDEAFFTVDHTGLLRAWTTKTGALMWDSSFETTAATTATRLWLPDPTLLATANDDTLVFYSATNGRVLGAISAAGSSTGKSTGAATWLTVFIQGEHLFSLVGTVRKGMVSQLTLVSLVLDEGVAKVVSATALGNHPKFLASSLQIIQGAYIVGLGTDGTTFVQVPIMTSESSQQIDLPQWHPLWTSMEKLEPHAGGLLRITGIDNRYSPPRSSVALFRFNGKDFWDQWYAIDGSEETQFGTVGYCPEASLAFTLQQDASINTYHVGNIALEEGGRLTRSERHRKNSPLTLIQVDGDILSLKDDISHLFVIACKADSATFFVTTTMGSTATVVLSKNSMDRVTARILWTAEEGLSSVSSGLLLDASHSSAIVDAISAEEKSKTLQAFTFSSRLRSQVEVLTGMLTSFAALKTREDDFGFAKVALLLSQKAHRVWGVPTSGSGRGHPSWVLNLPMTASRHVLVQGTSSSSSTVNGINAGTHSHEVLILSILIGETQWSCLDGITGVVHGSGTLSTPASIRQIIPIFGGGSCRQVAMLLLEDGSVSIIPNDDKAVAAVSEKVKINQNGLYTHVFYKGKSNMETFQILESTHGSFTTRLIGQTSFPGEKIVNVAYPHRNEVINSPCDVLGDDSLLLKYLNPHMVAVVTISESSDPPTGLLVRAINPIKGVTGKTKPKGVDTVTDHSNDTSSESSPNLFVSLVDTVSGRILYRASHANADKTAEHAILINENWVIYSFFNEMTKRSELGVLSMHEGMIDKSGLNAFTTPEQAGSFSSLSARESKPVVLAKTYAVTKPITALGVTATKGGISTKHILIASTDDRISSVPRNLLEPRRPTGVLKDVEKLEGLMQYHPLVPLITLTSPSYNQTVHLATTIISAPTDLESQSLVLAFGGPDIFFARVAPSKGFDLLPEDFNRILLTLVLIGLLAVLVVVKIISRRKSVKLGWT